MPDEAQEEPEQGEDDHESSLLVRLDEVTAQINLVSLARHFEHPIWTCINDLKQTVSSSNEALKKRVEAVLDMAVTTVSSLGQAFVSKPVGLGGVEEGEKFVKMMVGGEGRGDDSGDSDVDSLLEVHD